MESVRKNIAENETAKLNQTHFPSSPAAACSAWHHFENITPAGECAETGLGTEFTAGPSWKDDVHGPCTWGKQPCTWPGTQHFPRPPGGLISSRMHVFHGLTHNSRRLMTIVSEMGVAGGAWEYWMADFFIMFCALDKSEQVQTVRCLGVPEPLQALSCYAALHALSCYANQMPVVMCCRFQILINLWKANQDAKMESAGYATGCVVRCSATLLWRRCARMPLALACSGGLARACVMNNQPTPINSMLPAGRRAD